MIERGAARNGDFEFAAELHRDLVYHQTLENWPDDWIEPAKGSGFDRQTVGLAKPSPADINAGVKERAGNGRLFSQSIQNACVNALVNAGYGNENVRVYRAEVFAQKHD